MLDENTIPWFRTAEDRDRGYARWVAEGNTIRDGMMCVTAGVPWAFRDGAWRRL